MKHDLLTYRNLSRASFLEQCTGQLFCNLDEELSVYPVADFGANGDLYALLAAEFLLCQKLCLDKEPNLEPDDPLWDIALFQKKIPLRELIGGKGAMAHFPLAGHSPQLARLYMIGEDCHIRRSDLSDDEIDGKSYFLARDLAKDAQNEPVAYRRNLAEKWVITGETDHCHRVRRIDLGNKLEIDAPGRLWMIPLDNKDDVRRFEELNLVCRQVGSLEQAKLFIHESGVVVESVQLPRPIDELHILVGEALPPVLLTALLTAPQKVVLWASARTSNMAEKISDTLDIFGLDCEIALMPSNDMAEAGRLFLDRLNNAGPNCVISNVGGNKLMGSVALLVAQHRRIPVIYRDIDAPDHELEMIYFKDDGIYRNGKIPVDVSLLPKYHSPVKWQMLYDKKTRVFDLELFVKP